MSTERRQEQGKISTTDDIQKEMVREFFSDRASPKKAAGRALGGILEIITYYIFIAWDLARLATIEFKIPEYANTEVTHNVEFTLHRILKQWEIDLPDLNATDFRSITSTYLVKEMKEKHSIVIDGKKTTNSLLNKERIVRNSAKFAETESHIWIANISENKIVVSQVGIKPQWFWECKRVGVEEGMKTGPQTIEKAKQGAYVALRTSSLQKFVSKKGEGMGVFEKEDGKIDIKMYYPFLDELTSSGQPDDLVISVGVVSDHGNWTSPNGEAKKERKVLEQAYDYLLFLKDSAMAEFYEQVLRNPAEEFKIIKDSFYQANKKDSNLQMTKTTMPFGAHIALCKYFQNNISHIEKNWFDVLAPQGQTIADLKVKIQRLTT